MLPDENKAIIQRWNSPVFEEMGIEVDIKREDLIHPVISGNKWRKLKYNLQEAKEQGFTTLGSFGGAFSNHLAALACAGKLFGFKTIGIVRGEETYASNPTLKRASSDGMVLHFVDRETYRKKTSPSLAEGLKKRFGDFYLLPEGGTNCHAVKGCEEILSKALTKYDLVCCSLGTGGTIAGLLSSAHSSQKLLGFPALKGDFLLQEVKNILLGCDRRYSCEFEVIDRFHFGGYGKFDDQLIDFINQLMTDQRLSLDPIYTGKLFFGIDRMAREGAFPRGTRLLVLHTGGLQGVEGFNYLHGPLIHPMK